MSVIWFKETTITANSKNIAYVSYKKPDYKRQNQFCFFFVKEKKVLFNHLFKQIWYVAKNCLSFLMPTFMQQIIKRSRLIIAVKFGTLFCLNSNQKMLLTPPVFWMRDTDECSDFQKFFLIYFQYKKGLVSISYFKKWSSQLI